MRCHTNDGHHVVRIIPSCSAVLRSTRTTTETTHRASLAVVAVQVDGATATPGRCRITRRGCGARGQVLRLLLLQNELLLTSSSSTTTTTITDSHIQWDDVAWWCLAIHTIVRVVGIQIVRHQVAIAVLSIV